MTLRLSSSAGSSPTSIEDYIKLITDDTSISLSQKSDCLKTLEVVLKNIIDASKGAAAGETGAKYRTLKTDNPKLRARLFCCPAVRSLLLDTNLVGMADRGSALVLETAASPSVRDRIGLVVLPALATARHEIATLAASVTTAGGTAPKKAKLSEQNNHNGGGLPPEKLSEKQKARRLMEEKRLLEREREKAFRKETRAKIAADKLVRQKDENWKPSVSAAADKTGTGLLTFRDRHGE